MAAVSLDGVTCICPRCGGLEFSVSPTALLNAPITCQQCALETTIAKARSAGFQKARSREHPGDFTDTGLPAGSE